jgi:hypothetical protein
MQFYKVVICHKKLMMNNSIEIIDLFIKIGF